MKCIDADKLIKDLNDLSEHYTDKGKEYHPHIDFVMDTVNKQPTADVRENVKAKWIKEIKHYKDNEQEYDYYDIYCSACGEKPEKAWHLTNYCPNCGADIREVNHGRSNK